MFNVYWVDYLALQWRHNYCHEVSNHRRLDCLPNVCSGAMRTPKFRYNAICEGNTLYHWLPSQRASNGENVQLMTHRNMACVKQALEIAFLDSWYTEPWFSCQIRKIVGYTCAGNVPDPPLFSDPSMHHGKRFTLGSLTSGFVWIRWREKRSRHSRCICKPGILRIHSLDAKHWEHFAENHCKWFTQQYMNNVWQSWLWLANPICLSRENLFNCGGNK